MRSFLHFLAALFCAASGKLHAPARAISPPACDPAKTTLLILVHSKPSNRAHRDAIRASWASDLALADVARRVFLIGRSDIDGVIEEESTEYEDVLFLDLEDSYRNLTSKHVAGYAWAVEQCPKASLVAKTDDDVFLDTVQLEAFVALFGLHKLSNFILCFVLEGKAPFRDPRSKWFLSEAEFEADVFPNYCSGSAYLTTVETMGRMVEAFPKVKDIFIDDVFVTGLAAERAGVDLHDWSEYFLITHMSDAEAILDPARSDFSPLLMVAYDITPEQIRTLFGKATRCYRMREECYDLAYKDARVMDRRPRLVPRTFRVKSEL